VDALRAEGVGVWWDQDMAPNAPWEQTIENQLSEAEVVLVAWSPSAVSSENVKAEARWARRNNRLLQVFIAPCEPPLFFGERQGVDLKDWAGVASDPQFRALVDAIREALPSEPTTGLPFGTLLNERYEVRHRILGGTVYALYEGDTIATHEAVAIKIFQPRIVDVRAPSEAFLRDMKALTELKHDAINSYRVVAWEPKRRVVYAVCEFLEGISLDVLIGQVTVPEPKLRALGLRLAQGLKQAHGLGVVHRAVSPANIVAPGGRLDACKIVDFSLLGLALGDRSYAAPEQRGEFGGEVGPWTDVFGLGLVLVALARGRHPGDGAADSRGAASGRPLLPRSFRPLAPLLSRMVAEDPKVRFRSMDEVVAALDEAPAI
jgi:serine/threonine-protein kinase